MGKMISEEEQMCYNVKCLACFAVVQLLSLLSLQMVISHGYCQQPSEARNKSLCAIYSKFVNLL